MRKKFFACVYNHMPRTQRSVEHLRNGALQSRGPGYLRLEETGVPGLRSSASQELRAASRPGHGAAGKKFNLSPLDISSCWTKFFPIPSLLKGRCRDACSAGRDAAPAGVGVVPCAPGGPWVAVRPYYGGLPSMAGRGR